MVFKLNSAEFAEHVYNQSVQPCSTPLHNKDSTQHKQLGKAGLRAHIMPGIQALELNWQIPGNGILLLEEQPPNGAMHISFQLQGSMFTSFTGIHPLDMQPGVHNLVYLTENNGNTHSIAANQQLSALSLTVDKQFFVQCIEGNNRWSDTLINKIEKELPFAAAEQPLITTPQMHQLIKSIQIDTVPAPMKKLLLHSKILELIALQIEQLSNDEKKEKPLFSTADLQKLHVLKAYLDTHFLADLSLAQLSRTSCLNEFK